MFSFLYLFISFFLYFFSLSFPIYLCFVLYNLILCFSYCFLSFTLSFSLVTSHLFSYPRSLNTLQTKRFDLCMLAVPFTRLKWFMLQCFLSVWRREELVRRRISGWHEVEPRKGAAILSRLPSGGLEGKKDWHQTIELPDKIRRDRKQ